MEKKSESSSGKRKKRGEDSGSRKMKRKKRSYSYDSDESSSRSSKRASTKVFTPGRFSQPFDEVYDSQIAMQEHAAVLAQHSSMFPQPYEMHPSMYHQSYQHPDDGKFSEPLWTTFYTTGGINSDDSYVAAGTPYYYNSQTGLTQWEKPSALKFNGVLGMSPISRGNASGTFGKNGPPGCNVFVFHCPNEWTDMDLIRRFSKFGAIVSAKIMVDLDTGRSRGYGFISFFDDAAAERAISEMNGLPVLGKRLKVEIKGDASIQRGRKGKGKGKQLD